jgi:osmotically-inducible protein OsmY
MTVDGQLRRDVENQLGADSRFDSRQVGVSVKNGAVALNGQVTCYADWAAAQEAALSVPGVRAVANELRIQNHDQLPRSDADIAEAALQALQNNCPDELNSIQLTVSGRWISVIGVVSDHSHRDAIEQALHSLRDIAGVSNDLNIRRKVKDDHMKTRIQAALTRHTTIDPNNSRIGVQDGGVALEGEVGTLPERSDAEFAVWNLTGVQHVPR